MAKPSWVRRLLKRAQVRGKAVKKMDLAQARIMNTTIVAQSNVADQDNVTLTVFSRTNRRVERLHRYKTRLYRISTGKKPFLSAGNPAARLTRKDRLRGLEINPS